MGDRCHLWMRVRREDKCKIEAAFGYECWAEDIAEENALVWEDDQANYGSHEARHKAASMGAVFEGFHGGGGEYGPYVFAAAGERMEEAECDWNQRPIVSIDYDGTPVQGHVDAARRYLLKDAETSALIKGEDPVEARNKKAKEMEIE